MRASHARSITNVPRGMFFSFEEIMLNLSRPSERTPLKGEPTSQPVNAPALASHRIAAELQPGPDVREGTLMATSIISFPFSGMAAPAHKAVQRSGVAANTSALPFATLRHHGLHLVNRASASAAASFSTPESARRNSQAQADRIVAQVEQEIARQAFREAQQQLHGRTTPLSTPATVFTLPVQTETPASVARRLFAALLSFARPA